MLEIKYLNRRTKETEIEKVYGQGWISFFYGHSLISKTLGRLLLFLTARFTFVSALFGLLQKRKGSKKKVVPFIQKFGIDYSEFEKTPESFNSFNDFFIRKLKKEARPVVSGEKIASLPADGRYLVYPDGAPGAPFFVKGEAFDLPSFLNSDLLAKKFKGGAMVMARLCPVDYHRFHFCVTGVPRETLRVGGGYFSVNPFALKENIEFLSKNKRFLTLVESQSFGDVLHIEVGATNVGSVVQTHKPWDLAKKGEEKGYFQFGASMVVLLFEKGRIILDEDLIKNTAKGLETYCQYGDSLGRAT